MKVTFLAAVAVGFALLFGGTAMAHGGPGGAVYTQTNSPAGNAVHRLDRGSDGSLTPVAIYRTGGTGTGASLSSQGPVALSDDGRVLVAVNAGSNDISSFRVGRRGHLTLVDRVPSGGVLPNSVDIDRGSVYVLNAAGATPNVTAFDVDGSGDLRPRGSSALTAGLGERRAGVGDARRSLAGRDRPRHEPDRDVPAALRPPGHADRDAPRPAPCRSASRSRRAAT